MVIPYDEKRQAFVFSREYCVGTEKYELGFVKGKIDPGEDVLHAAARELGEEIGLGAEKVVLLKSLNFAPGFMGLKLHLVLATGLSEHKLDSGDEPEPIIREYVPLQLLPVGAPGELCLSGIQMSKGYWLRDELTQEKFCDAPFGYKVYHTGDLARWNKQGELEFMGRIDNQVKLRGFRIELGEIENQASLIEGIKAVAAEVREAGGSKHLVLYFTATSEMDTEEIRERLSASLTEYMVPDTYMQLNEMPLTPNGKVNRRALPAPVIRSAAEYVEPATETERIIAQAMQEVLYANATVHIPRSITIARSRGQRFFSCTFPP